MNTHKKILMLTTQLGYGGAETSFIRLANFLAQTGEVTVALFTSDYGKGTYAIGHEPLDAAITLLDSKSPCGRTQRWWRRIRGLRALKQQHDATISFLSGANLVNVLAGYNTRSIISLRGSRRYDPNAPRLQKFLFRYLFDPLMFHCAARIVPVSAGLKAEVSAAAGARALRKVVVIPPFIEASTIASRLAETVPEPYRSLRGQKVIVAVGRLSVEKGFHHLIRVFAALAKTHAGIKLLLVGDGPMLQQLRGQCSDLNLAVDDTSAGISAVIFAGYQKNPLPLMALGSLYALTSATEGFPNVVLEAMAAGIPVIAANTPWGARAILGDDATCVDANPYPTTRAYVSDRGVLMPRIDRREYESEWVRIFELYLRDTIQVSTAAFKQVKNYDISIVAPEWKRLLEGMEAHD
jgi:glycosyltransferase involved in cell wall biosynthesis